MITSVSGALAAYNNGARPKFEISDTASNIEANLSAISTIEKSGNLSSIHILGGTFNLNNFSLVLFNPFTPYWPPKMIGYNFNASIGFPGIFSDSITFSEEEYLKINEESLYEMMRVRFENWLQATHPDGNTNLTLFYEQFLTYQNVFRHLTSINPSTGEEAGFQISVLDCPAQAVETTLASTYVTNVTVRDSASNIVTYLEVLQSASAAKLGLITLNDIYIPEIDLTWNRLIQNKDALIAIRGFLEIQTTDEFNPELVTNSSILAAINFLLHPSNTQGIVVKGTNASGETLSGTDLYDYIVGSLGADVINGLSGNDNLNGGAGNDVVNGGHGHDEISGGVGDDYLDGGEGINTLNLQNATLGVEVNFDLGISKGLSAESLNENGVDVITNFQRAITGAGDDIVFGSSQYSSYLETGSGSDLVVGGSQWDYIYAGDGDDEVLAGGGDDIIVGGAGAGNDSYNGGTGFDTVSYTSAKSSLSINLLTGTAVSRFGSDLAGIGVDALFDIENIIGGYYGDLIVGDDKVNNLAGLDGDDSIFGGDSSDELLGGKGNDSLDGGIGDDRLTGGSGNDALVGGEGTDTAIFSGNFSDYIISYNAVTQVITTRDKTSTRDGTDTFSLVENFEFIDGIKTTSSLFITRPTYALEPMALTANEGSTVSYIINTTNVAAGTQLKYALTGITQADLVAGGTLTGQVTVGADGKAQLNVQLANDELTESRAEVLSASFNTLTSATPVLRAAGVLVNDSSKTPEVSVQLLGAGTVSEDGGQTLIYEVSRSSANAALRVGYSLSGTASALTDYTKNITTTVIEFAAGETSKQLIVAPRADTLIENNETVTMTLNRGTGYSLKSGQSAATGTISNDDYLPVYRIEALPTMVEEGQTVRYVLDTDHVATGTVVSYTLSGVSVADLVGAGGVAPSLTGTVVVGADGKAILDVMLKADELTEAIPETLRASFKVGTSVVATAAGVGIEDTSQNVEVNVNRLGASSVYENSGNEVVFEFNRTGEALGTLSVGYSLGGTARAGSDFTGSGTSGTVTFAAGSETAQLRLTLTNDQLVEADESLSLTLRTGTGYVLGEYATSELIVKNDDFRGTDRSEQINGDEAVNYLQGLGGVDRLYGRGGDDTLAGGSGKDLLYGGEGADTFYFDLAGRTNTDKIMDFDGSVDKIMLDSQLFAGLDANNDGVVDTSAFSQTGSAVGTQAQILYSASTGKLSYDADGTGAQQAQEFATLTANTSIWHDDILLKAA